MIFLISAASASYISLKTAVTSQVKDSDLLISISAVNKGDESAYSVQAELNAAGQNLLAEKLSELGIDQAYQLSKKFKLSVPLAGQYPLVVTLHYADANQYPFSALIVQTFAYKSPEIPSTVFGKMSPVAFWKDGKLSLTLRNSGATSVSAALKLIAPREITVQALPERVNIQAGGAQEVVIPLQNFSALSGSTYQVFAVAEYTEDNLHHTSIIPGTVKIVERQAILGIDYAYLVAALVGLVLLFVVVQFFKK
jgi:hypothetical protein